jgi:tripartite ATP-independent transporter DctM subunit
MVAIIGFCVMLLLVFMRMWIGFALFIVGFAGLWYLRGFELAVKVIASEPFSQTAVNAFTCMPLFCIMGCVISNTGMGADLYMWARKMIGHIRGGLGIATVLASVLFSAVTGNSQVTAMTLGKVSYPEMRKAGYSDTISVGGIAAGGTVGTMIPPSYGFIVYGLLTETSIGKLFTAGFIPAILQMLMFSSVFLIIGRLRPKLVPATPKATWRERGQSFKSIWPVVILLVAVLGGIYTGVFTPTEAGAVGAGVAIVIALAMRSLSKKAAYTAFVEAVRMTAMIMTLMFGAKIFLRFIVITRVTEKMTSAIVSLNVSKYVILLVVFLLYLFIGVVLDVMAGILLTVPFLYPIMVGLGFDPIWFGVFVVAMMELGEITPPIGLTCSILSGVTGVPLERVFKGIMIFFIPAVIFVVIICVFPQICMVLV